MALADDITRDIMLVWMREQARPALREIKAAVREDGFARAERLAEAITFRPVEPLAPLIEAKVEAAFTAGALNFARIAKRDPARVDAEFAIKSASQQLLTTLTSTGEAAITKRVQKVLSEAQDGLVQKAEIPGLAVKLNRAVATGGRAIVSMSANLTTTRMAALGSLLEAEGQGFGTYQIQEHIQEDIDAVCRGMHGKTFNTREGMDVYMRQLSENDPAALKATFPFPRGSRDGLQLLASLSDADLSGRGIVGPPYHPHCRGIIVPADTVPTSELVSFAALLGQAEAAGTAGALATIGE